MTCARCGKYFRMTRLEVRYKTHVLEDVDLTWRKQKDGKRSTDKTLKRVVFKSHFFGVFNVLLRPEMVQKQSRLALSLDIRKKVKHAVYVTRNLIYAFSNFQYAFWNQIERRRYKVIVCWVNVLLRIKLSFKVSNSWKVLKPC